MNKKFYQLVSVFVTFILVLGSSYSTYGLSILQSQVTTLPSTEGFGANTIGGRGGTVYEVTNTDISASESLGGFVEAQTSFRFASISDAHVSNSKFTNTQ